MATIIKKTAVAVKPVVKSTVQATKQAVKPTAKPEYEIVSMDNIQLVPKGGGGGKALSAFATKVYSLEIGQGIKISDERYNAGKGVASLYAGAKRRDIKLRVRRDIGGSLWLFRVEMPEVTEEEVAE